MGKSVKIAISVPEEVLAAAERERRARGEGRSEFFRHAVEALLRQQREREAAERYVRGYLEQPETEGDIATAEQSGTAALAHEPWN